MPRPLVANRRARNLDAAEQLVLATGFTLAAGPMYDYVSRSAAALLDGSYVLAVLGGGA